MFMTFYQKSFFFMIIYVRHKPFPRVVHSFEVFRAIHTWYAAEVDDLFRDEIVQRIKV